MLGPLAEDDSPEAAVHKREQNWPELGTCKKSLRGVELEPESKD